MKQFREIQCSILALAFLCLPSASAQSTTDNIVQAADKFLASLSQEQKSKVVYSYTDEEQRSRWSNFPTGVVPRGGLSLKEMSSRSRRLTGAQPATFKVNAPSIQASKYRI